MDLDELALVVKALTCGLSNCVLWNGKSAEIVRNDDRMAGLTPEGIKAELIRFVKSGEVSIVQKLETRDPWRARYRFYYKAMIPIDSFPQGLFVEIRLSDDDPDYPIAVLVSAHP